MTSRDLLVEIGTEELPPKALPALSSAFCKEMEAGLRHVNLSFSTILPFATPRRLAMRIEGLAEHQDDVVVEKFGPALKAAFDKEGNPTKAAEGFARSCGVSVAELQQKDDGKATKLFFSTIRKGAATASLIPEIIKTSLSKLPIPKRMRWGSKREEFVRPVHWAVVLFGTELIDTEILGVKTGKQTYGHRFHHPEAIALSDAAQYETSLLENGHVIASFENRRNQIRKGLEAKGVEIGANVIIDEDLLDEVTALVEWPVVLMGNFDKSYLQIPQEALVSSMKEHQKCFHLLDDEGRILPHFITISNLESRDPAQVIAGNEKVISPRLADASFFYNQDRKESLASRREKLINVVFQQDLGTLHDKSVRVRSLAATVAQQLNVSDELPTRAAELGKCDLLTSMVYEFPDLQGIMGHYYAAADGEDAEVALALNEQYMPRFSGDDLPTSPTGTILAIAERIDTIAGLYAINQPPTGSKDPFALRRSALGIIRILIEKQLEVDLSSLIILALELQPVAFLPENQSSEAILQFFIERLRAWYSDKDISADTFQSVEALPLRSLKQFDLRIHAVSEFRKLPEAEALAAANKRVANILAKLDQAPEGRTDTKLLQEPAEQALQSAIETVSGSVISACSEERYSEALTELCTLKPVIDAFFDQVMVNAEDPATRTNRLLLLSQLRKLFLQVADISRLQLSQS